MASVLFVCLGNICRSPLAEGVFRRLAAREGVEIAIDSAGTGDWHLGHPPDTRAQAVALTKGVDIAHLRARQIQPEDFRRFTHIVAMDASNLANLEALRPTDGDAMLARLMDYAAEEGVDDVPDPYYGGADAFEATYRLVEAGARGLLRHIIEGADGPVRSTLSP